MKQGFVKVAAVTPKIKVADTAYNGKLICSYMEECAKEGAKIVVFPELCITGYTCQDLFLQDKLLQGAEEELLQIAECSASMDGIFFVGLPYEVNGKLYNMAAVISGGEVLGMVPKSFLPNYNEFYECRHFTPGAELCTEVTLSDGSVVPVEKDVVDYRALVWSFVKIYGLQTRRASDMLWQGQRSSSICQHQMKLPVRTVTAENSWLVNRPVCCRPISMLPRERENPRRISFFPDTTLLRKMVIFLLNPSALPMV